MSQIYYADVDGEPLLIEQTGDYVVYKWRGREYTHRLDGAVESYSRNSRDPAVPTETGDLKNLTSFIDSHLQSISRNPNPSGGNSSSLYVPPPGRENKREKVNKGEFRNDHTWTTRGFRNYKM